MAPRGKPRRQDPEVLKLKAAVAAAERARGREGTDEELLSRSD